MTLTLPDLEDLFFDEGGTILLTTMTQSIFNAASPRAVVGSDNFTFDHDGDDDGLLADGTPDGENGGENAEHSRAMVYRMRLKMVRRMCTRVI